MTDKKRTFLPIAAVAALVLVVSACGGGGGNVTPPEPPPTACEMSPASEACVAEAKMAADDAKATLDAVNVNPNSTQQQIADAQAAYDTAMMEHTDAMKRWNDYLAMQPPVYVESEAMKAAVDAAKALFGFGTGRTIGVGGEVVTDEGVMGAANNIGGGKVTYEDGEGDKIYAEAAWPVPTIMHWAGSVWEGSASPTDPKDSIVVYTNIESPSGVSYETYYATGNIPGPRSTKAGWEYVPWTAVVVSETTSDGPNRLLLFNTVPDGARYSAPMFPTGTNLIQKYPDTGGPVEFAGSFNEVTGMFSCTATGSDMCSAETDEDGDLSELGGGEWFFTADSADAIVSNVLRDADYLDFGYWVTTTENSDGSETYAVGAFYRGQDLYGDTGAVEGFATYNGKAAGLYTKSTFDSEDDGTLAAVGRFTADAELRAYFGGPRVATDMQDSIKGTISNFMDDGTMIDDSWMVELKEIGDTDSNSDGFFAGGATTGEGSWSGYFYGTGAKPTSVAGEFDAGFTNGDVIGAFGATETAE